MAQRTVAQNIGRFLAGAFFFGMVAVVLFPVFAKAKSGKRLNCATNVRAVVASLSIYRSDWDGWEPPSSTWWDSSERYRSVSRETHCLALPSGQIGFALNDALVGRDISRDPKDTVEIFESADVNRSAVGPVTDFVKRHGETGVVGFLDGSARFVRSVPRKSTLSSPK